MTIDRFDPIKLLFQPLTPKTNGTILYAYSANGAHVVGTGA
jgi:hypothetical protein